MRLLVASAILLAVYSPLAAQSDKADEIKSHAFTSQFYSGIVLQKASARKRHRHVRIPEHSSYSCNQTAPQAQYRFLWTYRASFGFPNKAGRSVRRGIPRTREWIFTPSKRTCAA